MNFLPVVVAGGKAGLGGLTLQAPIEEGPLLVGIRAEEFKLVEPDKGVPLDVVVVEPLCSHTLITGRFCDQTIRIVAPATTDFRAGSHVGLVPSLDRLVWMDPKSNQSLQ